MNCVICNKKITASKFCNKILCSSECFTIDYWNDMILKKDNPNIVRIDGNQYIIGRETDPEYPRGYGGRKFHIRFFDNRLATTTNLWHQGEIPFEYKISLPDNAMFVDNVIGDYLN